jgi:hypothetical protein
MFSKGLGLNSHELKAANAGGKEYLQRMFMAHTAGLRSI